MRRFFSAVLILMLLFNVLFMTPSTGMAASMTFDVGPECPIAFGETYTESDMVVKSYSHYSSIADHLGWNPSGNALYFHGTNEYVEFRMVDNSKFDLISFDLLTNGHTNLRFVETSLGIHQNLPGVRFQTFSFSGDSFQGIEWFRVGTPWFATEIDNVNFTPTPVPASIFLFGTGLVGLFGVARRRNKK